MSHKSDRREFLTGKAGAAALETLLDRAAECPAEDRAVARSAPPLLLQVGRRAMACQWDVYLNAVRYPQGRQAALDALDHVEAWEARLTVYRDTSEVAHVNRTAHAAAVPVEADLYALLRDAVALWTETAGAFDITTGPLIKAWGFFQRQGRVPAAHDLAAAMQRVGSDKLLLDDGQQTVRFATEGMELNLGSIGKGYALDRAGELLHTAGVDDFLIHGGQSSVLARGGRESREAGWSIGVRHPLFPDRRLAEVRLRDQALGTSGSMTQSFRHQGRRFGHILDPRTGQPADGVLSATVLAPSAAAADALATAFFCLGPDGAARYCAEHPEIAALLVLPGDRQGDVELVTCNLTDEQWSRCAVRI